MPMEGGETPPRNAGGIGAGFNGLIKDSAVERVQRRPEGAVESPLFLMQKEPPWAPAGKKKGGPQAACCDTDGGALNRRA